MKTVLAVMAAFLSVGLTLLIIDHNKTGGNEVDALNIIGGITFVLGLFMIPIASLIGSIVNKFKKDE